jgi:hypothetical protein
MSILTPNEVLVLINQNPRNYPQLKAIRDTIGHLKSVHPDLDYKESLYLYINQIDAIPKCECGLPFKFRSLKLGYGECPDTKCSHRKRRNTEKMKQTNLERYGVEYPQSTDEYKDQVEQTNLKKYGVRNQSQRKEVQQKKIQTCQALYGYDYASQSPEFKQRVMDTNLEKYGCYASGTSEFRSKVENTCLNRYGVKHPQMSPMFHQQSRFTFWIKFYERNKDQLKFTVHEFNKRLEAGDIVTCKSCNNSSSYPETYQSSMKWRCPYCEPVIKGASSYEFEILEYINSNYQGEVVHGDRSVLKPKELDIWIPDCKFAIEFNGTYWHGADEETDQIQKEKHLWKTQRCNDLGITLFHIWEHDWVDLRKQQILKSMILSRLNQTKKVFAKKTTITKVNPKEAKDFLNQCHLEGAVRGTHYGLKLDNNLVAIMSFQTVKGQMTLQRYCSQLGVTVVGGATKLFKHFRRQYHNSVLAYIDREFSNGELARILGFDLISVQKPNHKWFRNDTFTKKGTPKKMFSEGYLRIWSCGKLVFMVDKLP